MSRTMTSRPRRRTVASAAMSSPTARPRYCTERSTQPRRGPASRSAPVQAATVPAMLTRDALAPPLRTPPAFRCSDRWGSISTARSRASSWIVAPSHRANGTRANRARARASAGSSADAIIRRSEPLAEKRLADLEPGLGGEGQRLHVDALVVAVEAPRHGLGGQGSREEAESVGHRAVLAKVRRVGEAHDHPREELGAGVMRVDDLSEDVPQRRARRRRRRLLGEELLDDHLLREVTQGLVEMPAHLVLVVAGDGPDVDVEIDDIGDDVGLHAAPAHGRREGRVRGRRRETRQSWGEARDALVIAARDVE